METVEIKTPYFLQLEGEFDVFKGLTVPCFGTAEIDDEKFFFISREALMAVFRRKFSQGFDKYDQEYSNYSNQNGRQDKERPVSPLDKLFPGNFCPFNLLLAA